MLEVIKNNGITIYYISNRLKNDKDIVLEAVRNIGNALEFASEDLRDDKEVVIAAVKKNGYTLKYASDRLKNDKELLEVLKKEDISYWTSDSKKWYEERMEVLANIREKEAMNKSIISNNKSSKKLKF